MFLTEIPENPEENELIKAMQVLRFEGEADDVAKEFMVFSILKYVSNKLI